MKADLHIHSSYSPDSYSAPNAIVEEAILRGLDVIAVTDHNTLAGSLAAADISGGRLLVIRGMEVSTADGHLLCFGVREEVLKGRSMCETIEAAVAAGGIAVPSHPFRPGTGCGRNVLDTLRLHSIETNNGRNSRGRNRKAVKYAMEHRLSGVGGSDAHSIEEIGRAYTSFEETIESEDQFLDAVLHGRCSGVGNGQSLAGVARTMLKIVAEYIRRGEHI